MFRRATVQDFNPAKLLNTETPKRRRPSVGNFSRPKTAQKAALTEQDYVLQVNISESAFVMSLYTQVARLTANFLLHEVREVG